MAKSRGISQRIAPPSLENDGHLYFTLGEFRGGHDVSALMDNLTP